MTAPKITFRALDQLPDDPRNARTHSDEQLDVLVGLITQFGFTNPILADLSDGGIIVAGHGRKAALALMHAAGTEVRLPNGTVVPAGKAPVLDCSGWTPEQRRAYALADNQSALLAGWNDEMLVSELTALTDLDFDIGGLGFDLSALDMGGPALPPGRQMGELEDTTFSHVDRFGVIIECTDEAQQQALFERLRDEGLNVKVVVV